MTMVALNCALSLMPITRIAVIASAIKKAGRLKPNSKPKICGALSRSCACRLSSGEWAERIDATFSRNAWVPGTSEASDACAIRRAIVDSAVRSAVQWSYASQSGIFRWKISRSSMKWFDHPDDTVLAPMAYSSVRSQPMIQAKISPKVA